MYIDLTGETFSRLTVVGKAESLYNDGNDIQKIYKALIKERLYASCSSRYNYYRIRNSL